MVKNLLTFVLGIFLLLSVLFSLNLVDATIDTVILSYDNGGVSPVYYDYAVIGKTYEIIVLGENLIPVNISRYSELKSFINDSNSISYVFEANNLVGERIFEEEGDAFGVEVISEADELVRSIGEVIINISDDFSVININEFNLSGKIIENFEFDMEEFRGAINLDSFLNGFTFDLDFIKDEMYPVYNNLFIDGGSSAGTVVGSILVFNGFTFDINDINNDATLLNQLIDEYGGNVTYAVNANAIKNGNNFEFFSEEGYANLNNDDLTNVQDIINEKIKYLDPTEIIDALIPLGDFSEFENFVDFETSIDFGSLSVLVSGEYALDLVYTDQYGNEGTMPFIVNLNVTNEGNAEEVDSNGTVTFVDPVISQRLERIENLPQNVSLTSVLYGVIRPSTFSGEIPSTLQPVEFMEINSNNNSLTDNGSYFLYFRISTSSILSTQKNNVSLYVQEGNNWIQLPTILIGEVSGYYEYNATINHFSNYLIGYTQEGFTIETSRRTYSSKDLPLKPLVSVSPEKNGNPEEEVIVLGEDPEKNSFFRGMTGAVIGALSSPGGILSSIFIFILIILFVILRLKKKSESKKKSQKNLNSKGDKIEKK